MFHVLIEGGLTFMCMAEEVSGIRVGLGWRVVGWDSSVSVLFEPKDQKFLLIFAAGLHVLCVSAGSAIHIRVHGRGGEQARVSAWQWRVWCVGARGGGNCVDGGGGSHSCAWQRRCEGGRPGGGGAP
jgi:hypothetical protein